MKKSVLERMVNIVPVSFIYSIFGLGVVEFGREVWLVTTGMLVSLLIVLLTVGLNTHFFYWGAPLLIGSTYLLAIGYAACKIGALKKHHQPDDIIIDIIFGMVLTAALCVPYFVASYEFFYSYIIIGCRDVLNCWDWFTPLTAALVSAPIPFVIYILLITWDVWPRDWLSLRWNEGLGLFLDDICLALFASFITYFFFMLPFSINVVGMLQYLGHSFSMTLLYLLHLLPFVA